MERDGEKRRESGGEAERPPAGPEASARAAAEASLSPAEAAQMGRLMQQMQCVLDRASDLLSRSLEGAAAAAPSERGGQEGLLQRLRDVANKFDALAALSRSTSPGERRAAGGAAAARGGPAPLSPWEKADLVLVLLLSDLDCQLQAALAESSDLLSSSALAGRWSAGGAGSDAARDSLGDDGLLERLLQVVALWLAMARVRPRASDESARRPEEGSEGSGAASEGASEGGRSAATTTALLQEHERELLRVARLLRERARRAVEDVVATLREEP